MYWMPNIFCEESTGLVIYNLTIHPEQHWNHDSVPVHSPSGSMLVMLQLRRLSNERLVTTMAEKKITSSGLKFSADVIETIAGIAASEIEGIVAMSGGMVEGFAERLGRKNLSKGVSVELGEMEVAVDLKVIVEYGRNVPHLYKQVVESVEQAIENMTGLSVVEVNMFVEGVTLQEEKEEKQPKSTEPHRMIR
ncbi:putative alkaline shock family protein YloU [Hazenella coriacea]|uniref:Alkaline shock protein 23 n=2 Tax=Hazenella coriacea TaxID=1179467 RepID=A0A4R3L039_9BACL|nr:putative alkaline shock family protein YloU [Hazenella coriacea]